VPETTKQGLLRRAVALAGLEEVAVALKTPSHLVEAWISGHAAMPDRKLLLLADFLDKLGRPEKG
jgi:hypothetical protein